MIIVVVFLISAGCLYPLIAEYVLGRRSANTSWDSAWFRSQRAASFRTVRRPTITEFLQGSDRRDVRALYRKTSARLRGAPKTRVVVATEEES